MKLRSLIGALAAAGLATTAYAAVTFEFLFDDGFPTAVSDDGTVVVGNTRGTYEPFRWTAAGGLVNLGRGAYPVVGTTAGTPGVSSDGSRVASTIHSDDSTFATAGRWTLGQGWEQLAPPAPPTAGIGDNSLADVSDMSGDGNTVVGLFWRYGFGRAHAYRWTPSTGMLDLGSTGNASLANAASGDGAVIVGWDETPTGPRRPTAWVNGSQSLLGSPDEYGEGRCVSANGEWGAGFQKNLATNMWECTAWRWDGSSWSAPHFKGWVDGNDNGGRSIAKGITSDGEMMVGYNTYSGDPFFVTGFIWTDTTGCMDIDFWLALNDVIVDPLFDIQSLDGVTPDGRTIIGQGRMVVAPYTTRAFAIHTDRPVLAVGSNAPMSVLHLRVVPNPARGSTFFTFEMPAAGRASLIVYDVSGRLVRSMHDGDLSAGLHRIAWDGRDQEGRTVAPGVYLTRLEAGTASAGGRVVVVD